ncbi:GTP cyclohydrolase 1 type 2 [Shewanella sp. NFH-SH190041]|uniref:Nif3-like dinuclear metal center hexameric protein n=1 Tax=Shewanella sp. NFH-SH190041 TaxID=2950245 RepID=UPI0021C2E5EB|nr:Nif3-like dinuclear metal center hexameric protein [Shewanella sp. NFH-SH190041]BDM64694.1 GTP cyclohydrolase 1 type 2 [Shewanella sp. NFH-SH190041]
MKRSDLVSYLSEFLLADTFKDYAPNGLQIEGRENIDKIVTGVSACQPLIDQAVVAGADALLVHHGFFWKNEPAPLVGMKGRRIKALFQHDINLLGYHLPLDAHPLVGNNAMLAQKLAINDAEPITGVAQGLVWRGELSQSITAADFATRIATVLGRAPLHIGDNAQQIKTLAWCTGGAQDYIDIAVAAGVDAFITGEVSERTFHAAMEQGISFYAAGHHATESYGIQALGQHLADKFGLEHQFIDIPNPV